MRFRRLKISPTAPEAAGAAGILMVNATVDRRPPTAASTDHALRSVVNSNVDQRPDRGRPTGSRPQSTAELTVDPTAELTVDRQSADRSRPAKSDRHHGQPRRLGRLAWWRRPAATVDQRAHRALLLDHGQAGLPRGYGQAFAVLVGTTLVAGVAAFLFSFGNVKDLAAYLGVTWWIQPLFSPAVDVTVIGLIIVVQYLTMAGVDRRRLRGAYTLLIAAEIVMLAANTAPSLILAAVASDQTAAGKLFGRAGFDSATPLLLILWSHAGPGLVRLFAEIRSNSDLAALDQVEARTLATIADRDQAAVDRAAAAGLVDRARTDADRILVKARAAADRQLEAAETVRRSVEDQARAAERDRQLADQEVADRVDRIRSTADREARRLAEDASADREEAGRLRELVDRQRQQIHQERAALEAESHQLHADRRALEDMIAELGRPAADAGQPVEQAPRPRALRVVGRGTENDPERKGTRGGRDETTIRVTAVKSAFPDWLNEMPKKQQVMDAAQCSSGSAMKVLEHLNGEKDELKPDSVTA